MSIFGSMKTAVSGMNAQANRLSTVADNIANVEHDRLQGGFDELLVAGSAVDGAATTIPAALRRRYVSLSPLRAI